MSDSLPDSQSLTPLCGAKRKSLGNREELCRMPAGSRTSHPGQGRCWIHGGNAPVFSGRYSKIVRQEIAELLVGFEEDPEPLNILPELHMVRALLVDFINRYEENREIQLAWYGSWMNQPWKPRDLALLRDTLAEFEARLRETGEWEDADSLVATLTQEAKTMVADMDLAFSGRPREILDIADAHKMAVEATKIVERIEKIRNRGAVSREDFVRVMTEIGRTMETALSPSKVRAIMTKAGVDTEAIPEAALVAIADDLRNTLSDLWMTIRVA